MILVFKKNRIIFKKMEHFEAHVWLAAAGISDVLSTPNYESR